MIIAPKLRRLQFSLRTLFVLATVLSWAVALPVYYIDWIVEREHAGRGIVMARNGTPAPFPLRLLGVDGVDWIATDTLPPEKQKHLQKLFPEARCGAAFPGPRK